MADSKIAADSDLFNTLSQYTTFAAHQMTTRFGTLMPLDWSHPLHQKRIFCVPPMLSNKGIVRPLQKRLSLPRATEDISRRTISANLSSVTRKAAPSLDLYGIYF